MGNKGSMDREDGPGFADAKADNIIRGSYMLLCTFCRAPTYMVMMVSGQTVSRPFLSL